MKLTTNKCALCEQYKILQDSHFVPKAIYRRLSKGVAKDLPAAIKVDPVAGTSILSGRQLKQHLLCKDCENLFSLHGESKVIFLDSFKIGQKKGS